MGRPSKTTEQFITEANMVHNNFFNYSKTEYVNGHKKVKIICPVHGIFEQDASKHTRGGGCIKCANERQAMGIEKFIEKAILKHGNKFDYSLVEYINTITKVKIICPDHGIWEQVPNSHLNGNGCPNCKNSKGENKIRKFLQENNFEFEQEKRFKDCKNKNPLPFDFYLPELNICIEFQGRQHFENVPVFGKHNLIEQIKRDNIKRDYCRQNNIQLIEICFKDIEKIDEILLMVTNYKYKKIG